MSLQAVKRELQELKRIHAHGFKSIEELLNTPEEGLHKLTDDELFRILQYYNPELKTEADLTDGVLERMVTGGYP